MWCYACNSGKKVEISRITDEFVKLNADTLNEPQKDAARKYDELFELQNEISTSLRAAFEKHRELISSY